MSLQLPSFTILNTGEMAKLYPLWKRGDEDGQPLRMWAERGLVHWEDPRTNAYGSMLWRDAAIRVLALSEMVSNKTTEDGLGKYANERYMIKRFVCEMEKVIERAKEQGSPDDPDAAAELRRRRRTLCAAPRAVDAVDPFPQLWER